MNTPDKRVEEWEKEFDKRFTDSSIDFRYKGDRDVMKFEISKILTQYHQDLMSEVVGKIEGMKKRELRSPRSFGDNESTVDVSSGYNQAIDDIIKSLTPPIKSDVR